MDRARLIVPPLLALIAVAITLPYVDAHGLWFDEAYTARLAALDWNRLIAGAQQDIHPPGWPLIAGAFSRLPVPMEWALRVPSVLSFAALVWIVSSRNAVAGASLLFYDPLVEQATQGRPYAAMALGLTGFARLVEHRRWSSAGIVLGVVSSLQAIAGPLLFIVGLASAPWRSMSRRDVASLVVPALVLSGWWFPAFFGSVIGYSRSPWYGQTDLSDVWILSDAGGAVVAGTVVVACAFAERSVTSLRPALSSAVLLLILEVAGVGIELRKTGLVLLPLLLASMTPSVTARATALLCLASLAIRTVDIPARPDLREARAAIAAVGAVPTIAVFASEAAWYLREPAPLPSDREPDSIRARIQTALTTHKAACLATISLPGTFPAALPAGLHTRMIASVTGLDVRVVGTDACKVDPVGPWKRPQ